MAADKFFINLSSASEKNEEHFLHDLEGKQAHEKKTEENYYEQKGKFVCVT